MSGGPGVHLSRSHWELGFPQSRAFELSGTKIARQQFHEEELFQNPESFFFPIPQS
jgi:hypothetical protein